MRNKATKLRSAKASDAHRKTFSRYTEGWAKRGVEMRGIMACIWKRGPHFINIMVITRAFYAHLSTVESRDERSLRQMCSFGTSPNCPSMQIHENA
jgi:hypothetical protein